ncbi:hypothetical protein [Halobaculum saliterrae]|nr:hypothetical protein [Halobaculum saliterrae]
MRELRFVPASDLYDPATRARFPHPSIEATDADVREAIEEVER